MRRLAISVVFLSYPLCGGAAIDGVVIESSGRPVSYAHVGVFASGNTSALKEMETDANGRFHLETPPAGSFTLGISKPNYIDSSLQIPKDNPLPANLLAILIRCGAITGHVLDEVGQPIPNAVVFAQRAEQPLHALLSLPSGHSAKVNASTGAYRLHHLEPGNYLVGVLRGGVGGSGHARAATFYPSADRPEPQTVSEGQEVRGIDLLVARSASFRISGRVQDPDGGAFGVSLVPATQPTLAIARVQTDADGAFLFPDIPSGRYSLLASGPVVAMGPAGGITSGAPRFARGEVELNGSDAEGLLLTTNAARRAAFALAPQGSLKGSQCSGKMELRLAPIEDWGSVQDAVAAIAFSSERSISSLAPGRYRVSVADPEHRCVQRRDMEIDLNSDNPGVYAAPMAGAGGIHGVVSAPAGSGAVAVELTALGRSDLSWPIQPGCPGECRFTFTGLIPGSYTLNLFVDAAGPGEAPAVRELSTPVQVRSEEDVEVKIDARDLAQSHP